MNTKQIKILRYLLRSDNKLGEERLYTYADMEKGTRLSRKQLHREITRLRHLGFVIHEQAWSERYDWYSGSGFMIEPNKRIEVEKLV